MNCCQPTSGADDYDLEEKKNQKEKELNDIKPLKGNALEI